MKWSGKMLAALMCYLWFGFVSGESSLAEPGDSNYCVELLALFSLDGEMVPPFDPAGTKFRVNVEDIHLEESVLRFRVNTQVYPEDGIPLIYVDGEEQEYDPNDELTVVTKLNDGIDGVEKDIIIKVVDPKAGGGLFSKAKSHTYTVTMAQKPEFNFVVEAELIKVSGSDGAEIIARPPFDRTSDESEYEYTIPETSACKDDDCVVDLEVKCPDVASGLRVNGDDIINGEVQSIDISESVQKTVSVICYYDDKKWTDITQQRYYNVILSRDIQFEGEVEVFALSFQGVCEQRIVEGKPKFDCRSLIDDPQLTVHTSEHEAKLTLISPETRREEPVADGIPIRVAIPKEDKDYTLTLAYGTGTESYLLRVHKPENCSALTCPEGQALKEPSQSAIEHLCLEDVCNEKDDAPNCCGDRAPCTTYVHGCLAHTALRFDAAETLCNATICKESDQSVCCQPVAKCSAYPSCEKEHEAVRHDSEDVECESDLCTPEADEAKCCKARAKCTGFDYPCQSGKALRKDAIAVECASDRCAKEDASVCCAPKANCTTYEGVCDGKVLRHDAAKVLCEGCLCTQDDSPTCCRSSVSCDTWNHECPAEHALRLDASNVTCKGDICTVEDDTDACCQARCENFDTAQCPSDTVLRHDDEIICNNGKGDRCNATECCKAPARCDTFTFSCPSVMSVRNDSADVECHNDLCVQKDEDVCCKPTATCEQMPSAICPEHTNVRKDAAEVYCSNDVCGQKDIETCCRPVATCDTFEFPCPTLQAMRLDPETRECKGTTCMAKNDSATCCGPLETCATFTFDCEDKVLREDAEKWYCNGTVCEDSDATTCCVPHATCLEFRTACPIGTFLKYLAAETLCKSQSCTDEDSEMCCLKRASCSEFPGKCPPGNNLWKDALCEFESCTEDDIVECCLPEMPELEGLMRLSNVNFSSLEQDRDVLLEVEQHAIDVIAEQSGSAKHAVDAAVSQSLAPSCVDVDFEIDTIGKDPKDILAITEAMKAKAKLAELMEKALKKMHTIKADDSDPITVVYIDLAEGQVDATHGGVYIPALVQDGGNGTWSVRFDFGESMAGILEQNMKPTKKPASEGFSSGDEVKVLVPLKLAAHWKDQGALLKYSVMKPLEFARVGLHTVPLVVATACACVVCFAALIGYRRSRWSAWQSGYTSALAPDI